MRGYCLAALFILGTAACQNDTKLEQLNRSFDQGYQKLIQPVQEKGEAVVLSRWDSLHKTYRLQLEETPPRGERAEQLWQNLRHRLVVFERQIQRHRQLPALYHLGGQCRATLSQTEQPLEERFYQILTQLQQSEAYYQAAERNLQTFSFEAAALGISKQGAGQRFLKGALLDSLKAAHLTPSRKKEIRAAALRADAAMRHFQAYLEKR